VASDKAPVAGQGVDSAWRAEPQSAGRLAIVNEPNSRPLHDNFLLGVTVSRQILASPDYSRMEADCA
jgi:hypothetical protein